MMRRIVDSIKKKFALKPAEVQKHKVTFLSSEKYLVWDGRCGSLLELAQAHGISADSDCRNGYCGTCAAEIVGGEISYTAKPAAMVDGKSCLLCIAVPKTDLILKV